MILLSDNYVANGSEPWLLPDVDDLPDLRVEFATEPNGEDGTTFLPYLRDPETLARPWAIPGTPGLEHRIGGLEKADKTGDISYDPANHDFMVRTRAARIEAHRGARHRGRGPGRRRPGAGARLGLDLRADRRRLPGAAPARPADRPGAPAPPRPDAGQPRRGAAPYDKVVIPEMNLGQLAHVIRARYLVDAIAYNQVRGLPFTAAELETMLEEVVKNV